MSVHPYNPNICNFFKYNPKTDSILISTKTRQGSKSRKSYETSVAELSQKIDKIIQTIRNLELYLDIYEEYLDLMKDIDDTQKAIREGMKYLIARYYMSKDLISLDFRHIPKCYQDKIIQENIYDFRLYNTNCDKLKHLEMRFDELTEQITKLTTETRLIKYLVNVFIKKNTTNRNCEISKKFYDSYDRANPKLTQKNIITKKISELKRLQPLLCDKIDKYCERIGERNINIARMNDVRRKINVDSDYAEHYCTHLKNQYELQTNKVPHIQPSKKAYCKKRKLIRKEPIIVIYDSTRSKHRLFWFDVTYRKKTVSIDIPTKVKYHYEYREYEVPNISDYSNSIRPRVCEKLKLVHFQINNVIMKINDIMLEKLRRMRYNYDQYNESDEYDDYGNEYS